MGILLQKDPWSKALRDTLPALIPLGLVGIVPFNCSACEPYGCTGVFVVLSIRTSRAGCRLGKRMRFQVGK